MAKVSILNYISIEEEFEYKLINILIFILCMYLSLLIKSTTKTIYKTGV